MKEKGKAAIVACSNGLSGESRPKIEELKARLKEMGLLAVEMGPLYRKDTLWSGTAKERAKALMDCYRDPDIRWVFDVSGGDLANEILPWLDFERIKAEEKSVLGIERSDHHRERYLCQKQAGPPYSIRSETWWAPWGRRRENGFGKRFRERAGSCFGYPAAFCGERNWKEGRWEANIRCLLKLAGTPSGRI